MQEAARGQLINNLNLKLNEPGLDGAGFLVGTDVGRMPLQEAKEAIASALGRETVGKRFERAGVNVEELRENVLSAQNKEELGKLRRKRTMPSCIQLRMTFFLTTANSALI